MRNHVFPEGKANLWIMLKPAEIADGTKPIKLITAEDTRVFPLQHQDVESDSVCHGS